jgi:uncharacterized protein YdgA (DUF945 family)
MKKIVIYIVLVAIGVLVSFPFVSGMKLKDAYFHRLTSLPSQPGVSLHNEHYQRGWFRSDATTRVDIDLQHFIGSEAKASSPVSVIVRSSFWHGPVLLTDWGVRFGLGYGRLSLSSQGAPDIEKALLDWLNATPLTVSSLMMFDQSAMTQLSLAPYEADHGEEHIRFGGASATLTSNGLMTQYAGTLIIQPSSILTDGVVMDLGESSGSLSYQGASTYTMVGETVFNIPTLAITSNEMSVLLENLNINAGSQINRGKLDFFQTIEVGKIEAPLPVTSAQWHVEFAGVSPAGLEAWSDLATEMQRASPETGTEQGEDARLALSQEFEAKLEMVLRELLQPELRMHQRLDVNAYGKSHYMDANLEFVGMEDGQPITLADDPMTYLKALKGVLIVDADEEALMNSPLIDSIVPLINQGFLVAQQGKLTLKALLDKGELSINGNTLPLEMMIQSATQNQDVEAN